MADEKNGMMKTGGYQPKVISERTQQGYTSTPLEKGYTSETQNVNVTTPPQGGSGVPPKSEKKSS